MDYHFRYFKILFIAFFYTHVGNAFELKCKFSIKKTVYSCEAQNLTIDQPHTMISSVSGVHLANLKVHDVKYVIVLNQTVKFCRIFSKLEENTCVKF